MSKIARRRQAWWCRRAKRVSTQARDCVPTVGGADMSAVMRGIGAVC